MLKQFTIHRTVFLHAAWLDQISIHCPIFLTAASRRSLDRVSVPVWGTFLSEPLDIVALVGRYPANWLMSREPIRNLRRFHSKQMPVPNLWRFTPRFHGLSACYGHVAHALRTLAPVADKSIATLSLPLDLHVLSLPLAFILSQDQTLHCTSFLYSSSTILTSSSLKGIYALMYFVLPYTSHTFFKYAACLYHYFNQLSLRYKPLEASETGCKYRSEFLLYQNLF